MTYAAKGRRVFLYRDPNDPDCSPPLPRRSDHRLKRFFSTFDERAWHMQEEIRYRHLLDLMSTSRTCLVDESHKYVPLEDLIRILLAEKDEKIRELEELLRKMQGGDSPVTDEKETLEKQVAELTEEVNKTRDMLRQAMHKLQNIDEIVNENKQLQCRLRCSEDRVKYLEEKKKKLESELADLRSKSQIQIDLEQAQNMLSSVNQQREESPGLDERCLQHLASERDELQEKVKNLEKELEESKKKEAEIEMLKKQSQSDSVDLEEMSRENECYRRKLASMKCLEKQIQDLKKQGRALADKYKRESQKAAEQMNKMCQASKELQSLREERDSLRKRVNELASYECQYNKLKRKLQRVDAVIAENETLNFKLMALQKLEEENEYLKSRLEGIEEIELNAAGDKERIMNLQCAVADQEEEMKDLLCQIERLTSGRDEEELERLKCELYEKSSKLKLCEEQLAEIPMLEAEIDELRMKLQNCCREFPEQKRGHNTYQKVEVRFPATSTGIRAKYKTEGERSSSVMGTRREEKVEMKDKHGSCHEILEGESSRGYVVTSEYSRRKDAMTCEEVQSLLQSSKGIISCVLQDMIEHQKEMEELEECNRAMKEEIETLKSKVEAPDKDCLLEEINYLRKALDEKDAEIARLKCATRAGEDSEMLRELNRQMKAELEAACAGLKQVADLEKVLEAEHKARCLAESKLRGKVGTKVRRGEKTKEGDETEEKRELDEPDENLRSEQSQIGRVMEEDPNFDCCGSLQSEIRDLKKQIEALNKLTEELKKENALLRELQKPCPDFSKELDEKCALENLLSLLQAELDAFKGKKLSDECEALRKELKRVMEQNCQLKALVDCYRQRLDLEKTSNTLNQLRLSGDELTPEQRKRKEEIERAIREGRTPEISPSEAERLGIRLGSDVMKKQLSPEERRRKEEIEKALREGRTPEVSPSEAERLGIRLGSDMQKKQLSPEERKRKEEIERAIREGRAPEVSPSEAERLGIRLGSDMQKKQLSPEERKRKEEIEKALREGRTPEVSPSEAERLGIRLGSDMQKRQLSPEERKRKEEIEKALREGRTPEVSPSEAERLGIRLGSDMQKKQLSPEERKRKEEIEKALREGRTPEVSPSEAERLGIRLGSDMQKKQLSPEERKRKEEIEKALREGRTPEVSPSEAERLGIRLGSEVQKKQLSPEERKRKEEIEKALREGKMPQVSPSEAERLGIRLDSQTLKKAEEKKKGEKEPGSSPSEAEKVGARTGTESPKKPEEVKKKEAEVGTRVSTQDKGVLAGTGKSCEDELKALQQNFAKMKEENENLKNTLKEAEKKVATAEKAAADASKTAKVGMTDASTLAMTPKVGTADAGTAAAAQEKAGSNSELQACQERLKQMEAENADKLKKLMDQHEKELANREKAYNDNLNSMKAGYETDIRKLTEKHKQSIMRLQELHADEVQEMNVNYETQLDTMQTQSQAAINDVAKGSAAKTRKLSEQHTKEMKDAEQKYKAALEQKDSEYMAAMSGLQNALTKSQQELEHLKRQAREGGWEDTDKLKAQQAREMQKARRTSKQKVDAMKDKMEEERKKSDAEIEALKKKLKEQENACECKFSKKKKPPVKSRDRTTPLDFNEVLEKILEEGLDSLTFNEIALVHGKTCCALEGIVMRSNVSPMLELEPPIGDGCPHTPLLEADKQQLLSRIFDLENAILQRQRQTQEAIISMEVAIKKERSRLQEVRNSLLNEQQKNSELTQLLSSQTKIESDLRKERDKLGNQVSMHESLCQAKSRQLDEEVRNKKYLEAQVEKLKQALKQVCMTMEAERAKADLRPANQTEEMRIKLQKAVHQERKLELQLEQEAKCRMQLQCQLQALRQSLKNVVNLEAVESVDSCAQNPLEAKSAKERKNLDQINEKRNKIKVKPAKKLKK